MKKFGKQTKSAVIPNYRGFYIWSVTILRYKNVWDFFILHLVSIHPKIWEIFFPKNILHLRLESLPGYSSFHYSKEDGWNSCVYFTKYFQQKCHRIFTINFLLWAIPWDTQIHLIYSLAEIITSNLFYSFPSLLNGFNLILTFKMLVLKLYDALLKSISSVARKTYSILMTL